jgi:hypothetical protein
MKVGSVVKHGREKNQERGNDPPGESAPAAKVVKSCGAYQRIDARGRKRKVVLR